MTGLILSLLGAILIGVCASLYLRRCIRQALDEAYLQGFRDGQMAEAKVQQASALTINRWG